MQPPLQPNTVFKCSMCGECCSSVTIPIENERAAVLLEKDWVRERLKHHDRELLRIDSRYHQVPLRDDQYCVFLGDDKRCLIEVTEGEALKPEECKRFPFARIELPNNTVAYDTSAGCKTVAEELLLQFAPIVPLPGREPAGQETLLPAQIRAYGDSVIDVEAYHAYCKRVFEICAHPAITPETALAQVRVILHALPAEPAVLPESAELSTFWGHWLPVLILRKPYGALSTLELALGKPYNDPKVFGPGGVPTAGVETVALSAETALYRGFLASILTRKVLLGYGHSLESILSMACAALVLTRWYARVLASIQGKTSVDASETVLAIRLVERYYTGHQPQFPERFRTNPFWKSLHKKILKLHIK